MKTSWDQYHTSKELRHSYNKPQKLHETKYHYLRHEAKHRLCIQVSDCGDIIAVVKASHFTARLLSWSLYPGIMLRSSDDYRHQ